MRIDEAQFELLPTVHSLGVMLFDPQWAERMHISANCELLYVISGAMQLQVGDTYEAAGPGELLLVPPETMHRDVFDLDTGLQVFMMSFAWPAARDYFRCVTNAGIRALPAHRAAEMAAQVERLRHDTHADTAAERLLVRARLHTMLLLLLREIGEMTAQTDRTVQAARNRRRTLMLTAKQYLQQNYAQPVTLDDIATALEVNPYYLSHVFSEENDFTLFAYLTTVRMEQARVLLLAGRKNVTAVAHAVGYDNSHYFSKVFRKHFGYPPSDLLD